MDTTMSWLKKVWSKVKDVWSHGGKQISVLFFVLVVLVVLWVVFLPDYAGADRSTSCTEPGAVTEPSSGSNGVRPVPLILEKPEGVMIDFGRDRGIHWRTVYLQAAKKNVPAGETSLPALTQGTVLSVSERPLERQELEGNIGPAQYVSSAYVTARKEVSLTICVDASALDLDPGSYLGSVRISGGGIQPVTVPVSVTLQYDAYGWMTPLLALVSFLGGSFVVWASHEKVKMGRKGGSIWRRVGLLPGWIADNYVGVAGGIIAMTSVFIARYWRTPAWGARAPEDWFALLGAMFTAYTSTLTAATAIVVPKAEDKGTAGDIEATA
jgi:hypothetical protein